MIETSIFLWIPLLPKKFYTPGQPMHPELTLYGVIPKCTHARKYGAGGHRVDAGNLAGARSREGGDLRTGSLPPASSHVEPLHLEVVRIPIAKDNHCLFNSISYLCCDTAQVYIYMCVCVCVCRFLANMPSYVATTHAQTGDKIMQQSRKYRLTCITSTTGRIRCAQSEVCNC